MKIYDPGSKKALDTVTLFLTPNEARELAACARDLAARPETHHRHLSDPTYTREIILAVYTPENLPPFDTESCCIVDAP
jgi:hypothetical protein